jgi:hypothetical protein
LIVGSKKKELFEKNRLGSAGEPLATGIFFLVASISSSSVLHSALLLLILLVGIVATYDWSHYQLLPIIL